jgi:polar amino acid transport system substrate-binding protein
MTSYCKLFFLAIFSVAFLPISSDLAFSASYKSTYDKVSKLKKISVGIGYTVPPMNYIDEKGKWTGFDMDLAQALAKKMGVKIKPVKVDTKTRVTFLAANRTDLTISSMSRTLSREKAIDFVDPPYFWTGKQFLIKKGSMKTPKDLIGKRIAVQQGSNALIASTDWLRGLGDPAPKVLGFQTDAEAFLALKQGKVDAFTQDTAIMFGIAGKEAANFETIGPVYSPGLYSIGVRQNDSKWRDYVSEKLQELLNEGTYHKIYNKWFGKDGKYPLKNSAIPRLPEDTYGNTLFVFPK